ncbi:hypothetical protein [Haloarcula nitratireducens]|uniref:PrgI family protein n=1 Tax=Haloarcula nitratireducens TaxID=2487749 RepID=A0AAW4PJG3_9EURY|nr:hypothetical protein [Halomicroarcula nitratireducens]MBX0297892.1 hypothetical protein [Halomicroarcula nitratireducens]
MSSHQPAKRIPKTLGTDAKLIGPYTLTDAAVALFPGVVVILLTQILLPSSFSLAGYPIQGLTLPLAAFAIGVGVLFVYLTPEYTTSLDWIMLMLQFRRQDRQEGHESAKTHTQIERVYPERDVLERQDGAFLAFVQVLPPPMALATDEEWAAKATAFQDFLNTAVTFPLQIFSTTQAFPVETYLDHYRERRHDPDVKANPRLAALIDNYVEWYERDLAARQMTIRDHYVVVSVTPSEVRFERESVLDTLAGIPILGLFVQAWNAPPIEIQRETMFEALEERVRRVESGIRDIDGCHASRIDSGAATRLVSEFWTGEEIEYGEMHEALRTRPLVGGTR